jgi:hypothetical protein
MLIQVLRKSKKTDPLTGRSILYQAYETSSGIYDYIEEAMRDHVEPDPNKKRPLSAVGMHFAENPSSTSRLYEMLDIFIDKNVYGITGLSFSAFLDMPVDLCEQILDRCTKKTNKEIVAANNQITQLSRAAAN